MKRKIVASVESIFDAYDDCMEYPIEKKLYAKLMNIKAGTKLTWLQGVLDCAEALNRGDFEGLMFIFNTMQEFGEEYTIDHLKQL